MDNEPGRHGAQERSERVDPASCECVMPHTAPASFREVRDNAKSATRERHLQNIPLFCSSAPWHETLPQLTQPRVVDANDGLIRPGISLKRHNSRDNGVYLRDTFLAINGHKIHQRQLPSTLKVDVNALHESIMTHHGLCRGEEHSNFFVSSSSISSRHPYSLRTCCTEARFSGSF